MLNSIRNYFIIDETIVYIKKEMSNEVVYRIV